MKRHYNYKNNLIAFFLAVTVFFTQLISTNASDELNNHVIKYNQDWLVQELEEVKEKEQYFNIDAVKLPFENEEFRKTLIQQAEGMLLLDTVTEDDGCTAYVTMNPNTYEIAVFTANMTEEMHSFEIEIQAPKVSKTTVDVYSEEKPVEPEPQLPVQEEIPEVKPTEPVTDEPGKTEGTTDPNATDPGKDPSGEVVVPPTETETNEKPQQPTEPEKENPKTETEQPVQPEKPTEEAKEDKPSEQPAQNQTDNKPAEPANQAPSNVFDSVDDLIKESNKNDIVFTTSKVMGTLTEVSESATVETPQETVNVTEPKSVTEQEVKKDDATVTTPATETTGEQTGTTTTEPQPPASEGNTATTPETPVIPPAIDPTAPTTPTTPTEPVPTPPAEPEKLVTESLEMGDANSATIEVPSGGFGVFRTMLFVQQDTVEYLPAHLYDYGDLVKFNDYYIYSDYYVGQNNGALQEIAASTLSTKTSDGFYRFKSKSRSRNPFPQQFTSSSGVDMDAYYSCEFPFIVGSDGYYVYDSDNRGASYDYQTKKVDLLQSVGPIFDSPLNSQGQDYGFYPMNRPGDSAPNNYFGMNLNVNFAMPKDGKIDNQDMLFEFSGDDDLWVYIDGKLALDLGGIHDKTGGSINFATGEIIHEKIYDPYYQTNSTVTWNLYDENNYVPYSVKNVGIVKDDYIKHTMQIFYLERGTGASNCKMRFNIEPIPFGRVSVTKEVTDVNPDIRNDLFDFAMTTSNYSDGTFSSETLEYTVNGEKRTAKSGYFSLKHGETAIFESIPNNKYVKFYEYYYTGSKYKEPQWKLAGGTPEESRRTDALQVGDDGLNIVYVNRYNVQSNKVGNLSIEKKLVSGSPNNNIEFAFNVLIADVPYTGNADIYTGGGSTPETVRITSGALKIKANQRAVIKGIPTSLSGTKYEVFESTSTDYVLKSATQNGTQIKPNKLASPIVGYLKNSKTDNFLVFFNEVKVVPKGSITIKNVVFENRTAHGDPIFAYRLEQTKDGQVLSTVYDYIRYSNGETNQKQLVFDNLPLGYTYFIIPERTMRYDLPSVDIDETSIGYYYSNDSSVEFELTPENQNVGVKFTNFKAQDNWFSHTDAVTNNFTISK